MVFENVKGMMTQAGDGDVVINSRHTSETGLLDSQTKLVGRGVGSRTQPLPSALLGVPPPNPTQQLPVHSVQLLCFRGERLPPAAVKGVPEKDSASPAAAGATPSAVPAVGAEPASPTRTAC